MFHRVIEEGIELRLMEESFAQPLFEVADRNRAEFRKWFAWVDLTASAAHVHAHILRVLQNYDEGLALPAVIFCEGELAGAIDLHRMDTLNHSTAIGYWLDAKWQGRGIMTKACAAMLDEGFDRFQLNRIEIRCAIKNERSCAIPARLGFTREAILREAQCIRGEYSHLLLWSMLAGEWRDR